MSKLHVIQKVFVNKKEAKKYLTAINAIIGGFELIEYGAENIKPEIIKPEEIKVTDVKKIIINDFFNKIKHLFENNLSVESISWVQYTPYFNDGETCYFSVNNHELLINGKGKYGEFDTEDEKIMFIPIAREFSKLISTIPINDFLYMFGDHAEITIKKDGTIETNEYKHE